MRMGETQKLAEKLNTVAIAADATNVDDLNNLFIKSMELSGWKNRFCSTFNRHVSKCKKGTTLQRSRL